SGGTTDARSRGRGRRTLAPLVELLEPCFWSRLLSRLWSRFWSRLLSRFWARFWARRRARRRGHGDEDRPGRLLLLLLRASPAAASLRRRGRFGRRLRRRLRLALARAAARRGRLALPCRALARVGSVIDDADGELLGDVVRPDHAPAVVTDHGEDAEPRDDAEE